MVPPGRWNACQKRAAKLRLGQRLPAPDLVLVTSLGRFMRHGFCSFGRELVALWICVQRQRTCALGFFGGFWHRKKIGCCRSRELAFCLARSSNRLFDSQSAANETAGDDLGQNLLLQHAEFHRGIRACFPDQYESRVGCRSEGIGRMSSMLL